MGYVFDFQDAIAYEKWYSDAGNNFIISMERQLMFHMLKPVPGETLLDIGCGTGVSLIPFLEKKIQVTGLDPSPYMIDIAKKKLNTRVDFHRGYAESLPFDDNAFSYVSFVTSLEYVEDPVMALKEAFRVAKDRVFIGALNKFAIKGIQKRVLGIFRETIFNRARFFSVWELKQIVFSILGEVPVTCRTVSLFPELFSKITRKFEQLDIAQRSPFGAFIGIVVTPFPRYYTTLLPLKHKKGKTTNTAEGYAVNYRHEGS